MTTSDPNSNMPFLRNEFSKIFEAFFYDDLIYKDDSYQWSNEELKIGRPNFDPTLKISQNKWDSWVPSDSLRVKKLSISIPIRTLKKVEDNFSISNLFTVSHNHDNNNKFACLFTSYLSVNMVWSRFELAIWYIWNLQI